MRRTPFASLCLTFSELACYGTNDRSSFADRPAYIVMTCRAKSALADPRSLTCARQRLPEAQRDRDGLRSEFQDNGILLGLKELDPDRYRYRYQSIHESVKWTVPQSLRKSPCT
jgi:hypothetical protein